jgi:hypothetical protein
MGRRLVGGVLVALGLVAASLAWAGFSLTRTILDPDASQRIADAVYDDPEVQAYLKDSMVAAAGPFLDAGVARSDVHDAADRALDDPQVEEAMVGGLVRAHQRLLGEDPRPEEPITIDATVLAAATRTELVNSDPALLGGLPEVPTMSVTLPTESIPDLGNLRATVVGAVALLATATVALVVAAFVVTDNRARVLRRVGLWAIGAAVFWVVFGLVVPWLAHLLMPDEAIVMASIWGVAAEGMIDPSIVAACAGVVALVLSIIWMIGSAAVRRSRRRSARRRGDPDLHAVAGPAQQPLRQSSRPVDPAVAYEQRGRARQSAPPIPRAGPTRSPGPATPPHGVPAMPSEPSSSPGPRWVEGVGYVDDADATRVDGL